VFEPNSRYRDIEDAVLETTDHDGTTREVVYKRRRLIGAPGGQTVAEHVVRSGERLDVIAHRFLADPTLFWRLCDANAAMDPAELEHEGRRIRIVLPGPGDP